MSEGSDARIGLSEFLAQLVAELSKARTQSEKYNLSYALDVVTLELDVAYTLTQSAEWPTKVKTEFWVLRSGPKDEQDRLPVAQSNMQHLNLRLTPRLEDVETDESEDVETMSRLPPRRLENDK